MSDATVDVETRPDGTLVIHPHGVLDADSTPISVATPAAVIPSAGDRRRG